MTIEQLLMDLKSISIENVDLNEINNQLESENRFEGLRPSKSKQTTISDYLK